MERFCEGFAEILMRVGALSVACTGLLTSRLFVAEMSEGLLRSKAALILVYSPSPPSFDSLYLLVLSL